jgi:hypothetical protein
MLETSRVLKFLGALFPVATVVFGAVGFLSIRSFINGVGLPEHTALSVDDYLQYGGRVFFGLIFQFLPLSVLLALLGAAMGEWKNRSPAASEWVVRSVWAVLGIVILAGVSIFYETELLSSRPLFLPWSVRSQESTLLLRRQFYLIEALSAATGFWLFAGFPQSWQDSARHPLRRALLFLGAFVVSAEILLLAPCFGRVVMVPNEFAVATVVRKERPPLKGMLLFSDKDNYFLYTPDCMMVEVPHEEVKQVNYEAQQRPEDACKK